MKKTVVIIFAIFISKATMAQVSFGVKGGVNLSGLIYPSQLINYTSIVNFNAGLLTSLPLSKIFDLQSELTYSGQGADYVSFELPGKISLKYLNIPVLIKYKMSSGFFMESGPQLGILLKGTEDFNGYSSDNGTYHPADFSWVFGAGYKLPHKNFGIDLRYNWGITNIVKYTELGDGGFKNSVFQFGLFYMFGGQK